MKKLLLLLTISLLFISSCNTTKIYYQEDEFYPENSRYETDWFYFSLNAGDVEIRFIKRSNDKIYVQGRYVLDRSFYVEKGDIISLKFADGITIHLNYDGYISKPLFSSYSTLYLATELKEISEWGTLEYIRAETSLGYDNSDKKEKEYVDKLNVLFTRLKNNEYDEIKSKD